MATPQKPASENPIRHFIQVNYVELIALGVVCMGIFLMVEQIEIRATLLAWGISAYKFLDQGAGWLAARLAQLRPSDLAGFGLVLAATGFLYWRVRVRMLGSGRLEAVDCPRCHNAIHRIHRTRFDHFLGKVSRLSLRRYRCKNCKWTGLRLRRPADYSPSSSRPSLFDS